MHQPFLPRTRTWKLPSILGNCRGMAACLALGIIACALCSERAVFAKRIFNNGVPSAIQPETLAALTTEDDVYRRVLALAHKPPYWEVCGTAVAKPTILLGIFGIPKAEGKPATAFKQATTLSLSLLTASGAVTDAKNVWAMFNAEDLSPWQRINGAVFALSISTNIQTCVTLHVLYEIYQLSWSWRSAHGLTTAANPEELIRTYQGSVWLIYKRSTCSIYLPVMISLAIYLLPGLVAYGWATALIFGFGSLVGGLLSSLPIWLSKVRGDARQQVPLLTGDAKAKAISDVVQHNFMGCSAEYSSLEENLMDPDSPSNYEQQHASFNATGAPLDGWTNYYMFPVWSLGFAIMGPVIARFYSGGGYLGSITATWRDRHFVVYATSLIAIGGKVVGDAHAGWSALLSRWAQFFNGWM